MSAHGSTNEMYANERRGEKEQNVHWFYSCDNDMNVWL